MKRRLPKLLFAAVLSAGVGAIVLMSCSQKEVEGDMMMAPNPKLKAAVPMETGPKEIAVTEELKSAYFEYDKWDLRADAKKAMQSNAAWLKKNPDVTTQIEGHCDERGSREYNLALGEKRARAARDYMVKLGIDANRISTVSYGALDGQNKSTWGSNRKAVFVLIYPKNQAE